MHEQRPQKPNGHGYPGEAMQDVQPRALPMPAEVPRRRRNWWRAVSGRTIRAVEDLPRSQSGSLMPLLGPVVALFIFVLGAVMGGVYKSGRIDAILEQHTHDLSVLEKLKDDNTTLKAQVATLAQQRTELSQYVEEMNLWSSEVRTKLITTGRARPIDIPPVPQRNGRGY